MNLRLLGLAGVMVCAVALPLAVASAGQVGDGHHAVAPAPASVPATSTAPSTAPGAPSGSSDAGDARPGGRKAEPSADGARSARPSRTPLLLGLGLATAARCGPELTSPEGVEAQTCVLTQGGDTWARAYYRNATGRAVDAVLTLMGPGNRTVRTRCALGADDGPGTCETPREATEVTGGGMDGYTAVSEFAARGGEGPLLLRSGSNSGSPTGS